ncbi:MAG: hypothetical protein AAB152_16770 [Candidatus Coatesbacteria bacterium]
MAKTYLSARDIAQRKTEAEVGQGKEGGRGVLVLLIRMFFSVVRRTP